MPVAKVVMGVEVGGTNTEFGFVDRHGNCLKSMIIPTNAYQPADVFFERLGVRARTLFSELEGKFELAGIGLGAPNANYYRGTIECPPNLSWEYVDVLAEIGKYFSVPVAATNDANATALGEMFFGAAQGMKNFIVITLGMGLGSGIVSRGEIVYGADGFAGEIGHTIVYPNGRECACGRRGCLETYASINGIRRTIQELMCQSLEPSRLRSVSYDMLNSKMIIEAAQRGDRLALEAFEYTGKILGMKLADAVAHFSPEAIILFGELADAGDLIFKPTKHSMEEHLFGIFKDKVQLIPSNLRSGNLDVLGASELIWNDLEKNAANRCVCNEELDKSTMNISLPYV